MKVYFNGSKVYKLLAPTSDVGLWITKGHLWQHAMASWLLDLFPDHLREFFWQFVHSLGQPLIPKFCLLVKTNQSMMMTTYGGFASRRFVGMFRWATKPCFVLIGVAGLTLLTIDPALIVCSTG